MNLLNNYRIYILLYILFIAISSCGDDLTRTNVNPNDLESNVVDPTYTLPNILGSTTITFGNAYMIGNTTISRVPAAVQYIQRDFEGVGTVNNYDWSPIGIDASGYKSLANSVYLIDNSDRAVDSTFIRATGLILKSFFSGYFSSVYGDMPYEEGMRGADGILQPKYDHQPDIFHGILQDLDLANSILMNVDQVSSFTKENDILYEGDVIKWRRFANSLQLRFLMRLSEKAADFRNLKNFDVPSRFKEIAMNSDKYPLILSREDNAVIHYAGLAKTDSYPGGSFASGANAIPSHFYGLKAAAPFVQLLRNNRDPRLTVFFQPVDIRVSLDPELDNELIYEDSNGNLVRNLTSDPDNVIDTFLYVGLPIGIQSPNNYNRRDEASFAGYDNIYAGSGSNPFVSYIANFFREDSGPLSHFVYMTDSEVQFILAEASILNWIDEEDEQYLVDGISNSLAEWNIEDGDAKVYNSSVHIIEPFDSESFLENMLNQYKGLSDLEDKREFILTQKWIASFNTYESWFNWRRTGYPDLMKNVNNGPNGNKIPIRFTYSARELSLNELEAEMAIERLEPSENTIWSKMWLLQGTGKPW